MTIDSYLGLIGFIISMSFWIIGAYILLRWGFTGVKLIWQLRQDMDIKVNEDARLTWGLYAKEDKEMAVAGERKRY